MMPELYANSDGVYQNHSVNIVVRARRVFSTYLGDNNTDNFYVQLKFEVTDTITSYPTMATTTSSYVEYHDLPHGIFIRPGVNNYNNGYAGDMDAETFISDYVAGLTTPPQMMLP